MLATPAANDEPGRDAAAAMSRPMVNHRGPVFSELLRRQRFPVAWAGLDRLPDLCAERGRAWLCPESPSGWRSFDKLGSFD